MGIKKAEIPNARNGRNSENLKDVREFIESGWDSAEVELNGRKVRNVYISLRHAIKRNGIEGVIVVRRGERVFLKRVK